MTANFSPIINDVPTEESQKGGELYETIDDLSSRLKVKKSWVYARTRETGPDAIPRLKAGKYLRFVPRHVDAWMQAQGIVRQ
jgi:hypothetical protein